VSLKVDPQRSQALCLPSNLRNVRSQRSKRSRYSFPTCRRSLSADASTVDKPHSSRAPPCSSPEMAHGGIAHTAASNALKTYAARLADSHDNVVRRLEGRNWHGLYG
jgi:hypothetical protein